MGQGPGGGEESKGGGTWHTDSQLSSLLCWLLHHGQTQAGLGSSLMHVKSRALLNLCFSICEVGVLMVASSAYGE